MLSDGRFWFGVLVGAGLFYGWTVYRARKSQ